MSGFKRITRQFIVFCGVGSLNTAVSLAFILTCIAIFHMNYQLANALGYAVGLCIGFAMHRRITFQAHNQSVVTQIGPFLIVFAVGYALQFLVLTLLVERFGVGRTIAQLPALAVYIIVSYSGNRFLTFKNVG